MGQYTLVFHPAAKKEINKLDRQIKLYIVNSLTQFIEAYSAEYEAELIKQSKIKKLKGKYKGFYRLRLRSYSVIYEKLENKLIIHIIRVAHRKEEY